VVWRERQWEVLRLLRSKKGLAVLRGGGGRREVERQTREHGKAVVTCESGRSSGELKAKGKEVWSKQRGQG
jgi:hypothetical protein